MLGLDRLLAFDMGSTTAKACLIENFEPLVVGDFEVDRKYRFMEGSGNPLIVPSVDMIEISADSNCAVCPMRRTKSLLALEHCVEIGVDVPETDVRMTRDALYGDAPRPDGRSHHQWNG